MSGGLRHCGRMKQAALLMATGLVLAAQAAQAQAPGRNVTTYTAEGMAAYAPANARDMVQRLPGFTIIEGDADLRGYAGARGNVLVDGAWPSSKHEDIGDLLERIPAASVQRIELIRGGAGVDMAGYPLLANVVRRQDATIMGAVEAGGVVSTDGWSAGQGQVEFASHSDAGSLDIVIMTGSELDEDGGEGVILTRETVGSADTRFRNVRAVERVTEGGVEWRQALAGGGVTAKAALLNEQESANTEIRDAGFGIREQVREDEERLSADLSARYEREFGDRWKIETLASQRLGWLEAFEASEEDDEFERFNEETDTGESILRADASHEASGELRLSAGLEGAFNFLESVARLEENGETTPIPGSDVRIEEQRIESSFASVWKPLDSWVFEAGVRFESSVITQSGDSPLERDFFYAKPRVSADWAVDAFNDVRVSYTREVGQLDFGDFVASASLQTGAVSAGNARLEPDKTSRWTASWERRFDDDAAVKLTWMHEAIEDVVDRVLVSVGGDQFDAPGNIGDGEAESLQLEVTAAMDALGLAGGQLRSSMTWRSSGVADPVTGERRRISEQIPIEGFVSLTQDMPSLGFTWGVEVNHAERQTSYRFDEIVRSSEAVSWELFAEWRIDKRWTLKVEAANLLGRTFHEQRTRHGGVRSGNPIDELEDRSWRTPGYVTLTIRHSMGG